MQELRSLISLFFLLFLSEFIEYQNPDLPHDVRISTRLNDPDPIKTRIRNTKLVLMKTNDMVNRILPSKFEIPMFFC
jgi:hypothetical protein